MKRIGALMASIASASAVAVSEFSDESFLRFSGEFSNSGESNSRHSGRSGKSLSPGSGEEALCKSMTYGDPSKSQPSDKFAPRFDGLRFIETLVTAHR
ncbi:hypothetical protein AMTRI_Chr11g96220 [Amborella trichopoda]|uniref:Uncharacterized protein n=1 Tax=Amborella trichopoda TaxID=13333 RepID=U5D245_AMBTC|nr:uncharacterized protein LOC18444808 [Amborella trichopoda]ERN16489.1 hypothetical protein AMTR_s00031p00039480 [Amborella trichopoda]|eukprot:XP_006855022.1 uncharacterized protein LOC18444808 [Amborella trichopoda]